MCKVDLRNLLYKQNIIINFLASIHFNRSIIWIAFSTPFQAKKSSILQPILVRVTFFLLKKIKDRALHFVCGEKEISMKRRSISFLFPFSLVDCCCSWLRLHVCQLQIFLCTISPKTICHAMLLAFGLFWFGGESCDWWLRALGIRESSWKVGVMYLTLLFEPLEKILCFSPPFSLYAITHSIPLQV